MFLTTVECLFQSKALWEVEFSVCGVRGRREKAIKHHNPIKKKKRISQKSIGVKTWTAFMKWNWNVFQTSLFLISHKMDKDLVLNGSDSSAELNLWFSEPLDVLGLITGTGHQTHSAPFLVWRRKTTELQRKVAPGVAMATVKGGRTGAVNPKRSKTLVARRWWFLTFQKLKLRRSGEEAGRGRWAGPVGGDWAGTGRGQCPVMSRLNERCLLEQGQTDTLRVFLGFIHGLWDFTSSFVWTGNSTPSKVQTLNKASDPERSQTNKRNIQMTNKGQWRAHKHLARG